MTTLSKPVTREVKFHNVKRPVMVTLDPDLVLRFREKGTRTEYVLPLQTAFIAAIGARGRY